MVPSDLCRRRLHKLLFWVSLGESLRWRRYSINGQGVQKVHSQVIKSAASSRESHLRHPTVDILQSRNLF